MKRWYIALFLIVIFLVVGVPGVLSQRVDVPSGVLINVSILVIYDEFRNSPLTTDFDSLDNDGLSNIPAMALDNLTYARVDFLQPIDLTQVVINNTVDLDAHIDTDTNYVFLNTTHFFNLAVPVDIYLYNVSLSNPRILRNGVVCGAPECVVLSNDGSTIRFTTTTLTSTENSVFEAEETPSGTSGGGGGGGGRRLPDEVLLNYTLVPAILEVTLEQGQSVPRTLVVENTGDVFLSLDLDILSLNDFITLDREVITVDPETSVPFIGVFSVGERERGGVYTGQILAIYNESIQRSSRVVLNVVERFVLFDLESDLERTVVRKNQKLRPNLNMINLGDVERVDVSLDYFVKDFENNEVLVGNEIFTIDGSANVDRAFSLPRDIKAGEYVFYARLNYQDSFATASNVFTVTRIPWELYVLILAIIIGGTTGILLYFDSDLRRFRWVIASGREALKTGNIHKAIARYKKLRQNYYHLFSHERRVAKGETLGYYEHLAASMKHGKTSGKK